MSTKYNEEEAYRKKVNLAGEIAIEKMKSNPLSPEETKELLKRNRQIALEMREERMNYLNNKE